MPNKDHCEQAKKELQQHLDERERVQKILDTGVMEPGRATEASKEFDSLPEDLEERMDKLKEIIRHKRERVRELCPEEERAMG